MKYKKELIMILLIGIILRLVPVAINMVPLGYDMPFHLNSAAKIIETQSTANYPYYPPIFHVLLASAHTFSGIDLLSLGMFLLPIISSIIPLVIFVFLKQFGEKNALIGAFLAAVSPSLMGSSFDSPEIIVIVFLPLIAGMVFRKKIIGYVLLASTFLLNYFTFIAAFALIFAQALFKKENRFKLLFSAVALIGFSLFFGIVDLSSKNIFSGMEFIQNNIGSQMHILAFVFFLVSFPVLLFGKKSFWKKMLGFSIVGMATIFLSPVFRAWEFMKFFGLAISIEAGKMKKYRNYALGLGMLFLFGSIFYSGIGVFPRIQAPEVHALEFMNQKGCGKILMAPSLSEYFAFFSGSDKRIVVRQFYENMNEQNAEALGFLMGNKNYGFLDDEEIMFIGMNFEDKYKRDFSLDETRFNKIYSMRISQSFLFDWNERSNSFDWFEFRQ